VNTSLDTIVAYLDRVLPTEILIVLLIIGVIIFIWDMMMRQSSAIQTSGGINEKSEVIAVSGSSRLPGRSFSSTKLGLSSQPHSLIKEEGFIIPVDILPSTKKVKDRHVIQTMIHMRLIEENLGKRPPYGILILGKEQRSVRIKNTEEKQHWLDTLLAEMHSAVEGVPVVAKPAYYKCIGCDVRSVCEQTSFKGESSRSQGESDSSDEDAAS